MGLEWTINKGIATGRIHKTQPIMELLKLELCQDYAKGVHENGIYAIALADGMGSSIFSRYGAETSVETICGHIVKPENFDILFNAIHAIKGKKEEISLSMLGNDFLIIKKILQDAITNRIDSLLQVELKDNPKLHDNLEPMHLASTLLFAAINAKEGKYITGHIGDGYIACLKEVKEGVGAMAFSDPSNGEYANETFFVTEKNMEDNFFFKAGKFEDEQIVSFALMSDGAAAGLWKKKDKAFNSYLQEYIFKNSDEDIKKLMEEIGNKVTEDDCSLISLTRNDAKGFVKAEEKSKEEKKETDNDSSQDSSVPVSDNEEITEDKKSDVQQEVHESVQPDSKAAEQVEENKEVIVPTADSASAQDSIIPVSDNEEITEDKKSDVQQQEAQENVQPDSKAAEQVEENKEVIVPTANNDLTTETEKFSDNNKDSLQEEPEKEQPSDKKKSAEEDVCQSAGETQEFEASPIEENCTAEKEIFGENVNAGEKQGTKSGGTEETEQRESLSADCKGSPKQDGFSNQSSNDSGESECKEKQQANQKESHTSEFSQEEKERREEQKTKSSEIGSNKENSKVKNKLILLHLFGVLIVIVTIAVVVGIILSHKK